MKRFENDNLFMLCTLKHVPCEMECFARLPLKLYNQQPTSNCIPWTLVEDNGRVKLKL